MDSQPGGSREPHLLNLKVMRLSRPTLAKHSYPFALEPTPNGSQGVSDQLRAGIAAQRPVQALSLANGDAESLEYVVPFVQDVSLTPMLTLPSSFGSINLGETFTATICLSNDAPVPVGSARLVVSMVVGNSATVVGEIQPPSKEGVGIMESGQNMEMIVSCEMRELGLHILQCAVDYGSSSGPRTYTRSYRFNVRLRESPGHGNCTMTDEAYNQPSLRFARSPHLSISKPKHISRHPRTLSYPHHNETSSSSRSTCRTLALNRWCSKRLRWRR